MDNTTIELDPVTEASIRSFLPVQLTPHDLYYFADFFLSVGIATCKSALKEHPELKFQDLIVMAYKLNDA